LLEEGLAAARKLTDHVFIALASRSLGTVAWLQGDDARACALHKTSLRLYRDIEDRWGITECLEGLAEVSSGQAAPEAVTTPIEAQPGMLRAVRLYGAAAALRESTGNPRRLAERIRYQRIVAALTAALGETVFAAAWEEGRVLTLEQAIAEGLSSAGQ
jgi:non-specific serine/threonine protein kinase